MLSWRLHLLRLQLGAALGWIVGGFAFAILLAAVAPLAFGLGTYTVRSGSMEPAIGTGDVIVVSPISPGEAHPGDIVTFKDPQGGSDLITHRVRAVREKGGKFLFVTRGDANNTSEHWNVPASGSMARVVYRVPMLGYGLARIGSSGGRIALIVLPALLLCLLGLVRIWRPQHVGGPEPAPRVPDLVRMLQYRRLSR